MKKYLCLLLVFLPLAIFAQHSEVFKIDSLPTQGLILDKGWKWNAGDNSDFARPDFDDSAWESIDPAKDIFDLPQLDKKTGQIGWFRIRISIDTRLSRQLVFQLNQSGASEIYLNGKLIHQIGVLSKNLAEIRAFTTSRAPLTIPFSPDEDQVLAIRYALQPNISYGQHFGISNIGLQIHINTVEGANKFQLEQLLDDRNGNLYVGSFGILAILFFTLFLFFPARKESLYFAIYTIIQALTWSYFYKMNLPIEVKNIFILKNSYLIFQTVSYFFLLLSVYTIFKQKPGWIFWIFRMLCIVAILCGTYIFPLGWLVYGTGLSTLLNLEATRLAFIAMKRKQKGAWIMVIGGAIYSLSWFLFNLRFLHIFNFDIGIDFFLISILSIPVSFAIYFGYDFGLTNRILQQKLLENEVLSKEKQEILSTQNETLEKQVAEKTAELSKSLTALKQTQSQLIQKEKLASLGQLTAGIAHEIQNPLNFVNNFSEVSNELIDEMNTELDKGNINEAKLIARDIKQNLEKINHHGKRADAIVKGMLQHSQISTGQKEPTDINKLCVEYLRLSYHGLLAKDKSFNATLKTDFDTSIGNINIIPQDIGRVLLNLYNNAFYAVNEKTKSGVAGYEPTVSVSSKKINSNVEIKVADNGNGIPQKIVDKIFQPFFTTKPTGQGTGLGLSLSYDIVKAHGGEIKMETQEGEGTTFTIVLPVT